MIIYMARPESTPSILDILPPNFAVRLLVMIAAVSLLFFLAYLPWLILDRRRITEAGRRQNEHPHQKRMGVLDFLQGSRGALLFFSSKISEPLDSNYK